MRTRLEVGPCRRELVAGLNGQEASQTALPVAENLFLAQGSFNYKDFIKKAAEEKWPLRPSNGEIVVNSFRHGRRIRIIIELSKRLAV